LNSSSTNTGTGAARDTGLGLSTGSPNLRTGVASHSNDFPDTPRIGGGRSMGGATDTTSSSPFLRPAGTAGYSVAATSRGDTGFGLDFEGPGKGSTTSTGGLAPPRPGSPSSALSGAPGGSTSRPGSSHGLQPATPTLSASRDGRAGGSTGFGLELDDHDDRDNSRLGASNRGGIGLASAGAAAGDGRDRQRMVTGKPGTHATGRNASGEYGSGFGLDAEGPRGSGAGGGVGLRGGLPQRQPDYPTVDSIGSVAAARRASGLDTSSSAHHTTGTNRSAGVTPGASNTRGPATGGQLGPGHNTKGSGFGLDAEERSSPSAPRAVQGVGRAAGTTPSVRDSGFGLDAEKRPGSAAGGRPGAAAAKQQQGFGLEADAAVAGRDNRSPDGRSRSNGRGDRDRMIADTGGTRDGYGLMAEGGPQDRQGQRGSPGDLRLRGPGAPAGAKGGLFGDDDEGDHHSTSYGFDASGAGRPPGGRRRLGIEGEIGRPGEGGGLNSPGGFRRPRVREGGPDLPADSGGGPLNLQVGMSTTSTSCRLLSVAAVNPVQDSLGIHCCGRDACPVIDLPPGARLPAMKGLNLS
jgi:hypothetical protein